MPKVSVIIPVYNVEAYLCECLDSIVNQTLSDIEIICVDDGSTDSSVAILQEYAERDNRVKIIRQKNQYAGVARNKGLAVANGEYVIFLDSDDIFDTKMLEKLVEKAQKTDADITVCRCQWFMMENNELKSFKNNFLNEYLPQKEVFSAKETSSKLFQAFVGWPWDKLYKREFILKHCLKFQALRHSNDTYFVFMSLMLAEKISTLENVLVTYRVHKKSLANTKLKAPECFYYALKALYVSMKNLGIFEIFEQSYINYCLSFAIWHKSSVKNRVAKKIIIDYLTELLYSLNFSKYKCSYFYSKKEYRKVSKYCLFRNIFSLKSVNDEHILTILGFRFELK